jgi:hypothetical protein
MTLRRCWILSVLLPFNVTKPNGGFASARNAGSAAAHVEYIPSWMRMTYVR